ncbi:peptidoglycan editing factor PgeF [Marinicaulis flavus]|uniref:Purine nucleoside phosphorylase n=2 Tax=Hyphococcus luteus TaxID=2058213 RepID=A0A2S7K283_9PROT|nr:peptidoglycan editing factor PgeF [Marinicaulis flavus]
MVSPLLDQPGLSHGFFSRDGGVSAPPYASLNTGPGSDDRPENIAENRRRCAGALGVAPERLLTGHQVHSPDVLVVEGPWENGPEKADGLVTRTPGLALGVLAADCMPFLFADADAGIIGSAHAGWRGALAGVLENTVAAMIGLGARAERIRAAAGPCLRQPNFEVGLDLLEAFTNKHPEAERFFAPGAAPDKRWLDLVGFGRWRLEESGVTQIDDIGLCTLGDPDRFFSYRAMRRRGEADYGRNLSAIALKRD